MDKLRYEYLKGTSTIVDNEVDEFIDDVVEKLNTQHYSKLELLEVKQRQDKQIAKLKAENERLINDHIRTKNKLYKRLDEINDLQQQLKEKDEELKQQEKHIVGQNIINNQLKNKLKTNTKQVCDKIRERYDLYSQPTECGFGNMVSLENLSQFLDQIEKGE